MAWRAQGAQSHRLLLHHGALSLDQAAGLSARIDHPAVSLNGARVDGDGVRLDVGAAVIRATQARVQITAAQSIQVEIPSLSWADDGDYQMGSDRDGERLRVRVPDGARIAKDAATPHVQLAPGDVLRLELQG